jgi:hypothetical protein
LFIFIHIAADPIFPACFVSFVRPSRPIRFVRNYFRLQLHDQPFFGGRPCHASLLLLLLLLSLFLSLFPAGYVYPPTHPGRQAAMHEIAPTDGQVKN